jgi:hypothetical protein
MTLPVRSIQLVLLCLMVAPVAAQESITGAEPLAHVAVASADVEAAAPSAATDPVGETVQPEPPAPTPAHTGIAAMIRAMGRDIVNLPSKENLLWVGIGTGLALAAHPADSSTNARLSGPTLNKLFAPGAVLGQSYTLLPVAATIYAFGRIKDEPKVSHTGSDLIQSLAIAELITESLKYTVRRERPDGSGRNSFPSGHAADTMAFATALERHFDWRLWLPAYTFATYVAMSRLHDNVHYLSDVVAGSAVGIIAGRTVTRHGRTKFPVEAMAVPGGFAIGYVRRGN